MKNFIVLHNIRSAQNVGAIFRTSDALAIGKIYLTGYSPAPLDRFGRKNSKIQKTALGAEEGLPWEREKDLGVLIQKLQGQNYKIFAVEQNSKSLNYKEAKLTEQNAFIFGNEKEGLSEETLKKCSSILEIPMRGKKESLNVSVSLGIVLFRLLDS